MSLNFLNPQFLIALAAVGLPILIHLLSRRKVQTIRFPAVRFILLSQKRVAKKYQFKNLLLLLLRSLMVLALVLLVANPVFVSQTPLWGGAPSTKRVVILDNSLSMGLDRETFPRAKEVARRIVSDTEDPSVAVLSTDPLRSPKGIWGKATALKQIDEMPLSQGGADYLSAFRTAFESLGKSGVEREVVLITDLAEGDWDQFDFARIGRYDPMVSIRIIHAASERSGPNVSVSSVRAKSGPIAEGLRASLVVEGLSFSDRPAENLVLQLFLNDEKVDQRIFTVSGRGKWTQQLDLTVDKAGSRRGLLRLQGTRLMGNADHHFTLEAGERLKTYLVDGDPKTSIVQSETFFLSRALHPTVASSPSAIDPEVISPEELARTALGKAGAIFLCNVQSVTEELKQKLFQYVQKGRGIVFFLGDQTRAGDMNRFLFDERSPLLPARLGTVKKAGGKGVPIERMEEDHPVLKIFRREDLATARFQSYFTVDPPPGQAKILLRLEGGDPLLVERRVGAGTVLLFTSSADRDWNDFGIKASYVPLMQQLGHYLAGETGESISPSISVGDTKEFKVDRKYGGSVGHVFAPDKKQMDILFKAVDNSAVATFRDHPAPGPYRLQVQDLSLSYSVNAPLRELDAQPISETLLREKFRPAKIEVARLGSGKFSAQAGKRDLASFLLLTLTALLVFEGVVSHRKGSS